MLYEVVWCCVVFVYAEDEDFFSEVLAVVLDEADRMLQKEFDGQVCMTSHLAFHSSGISGLWVLPSQRYGTSTGVPARTNSGYETKLFPVQYSTLTLSYRIVCWSVCGYASLAECAWGFIYFLLKSTSDEMKWKTGVGKINLSIVITPFLFLYHFYII